MKNRISVIIPVYNEEKYIGKCLDSLAIQTLKSMEVIVVDDGSTDKTLSVLSEFSIKKQKHQGPGIARNYGARKAKGEILVFVDADMKLDKNYLKMLVRPILQKKALATFTREEFVANPGNIWSQCWNINNEWPERLHIDPNLGNEANNFRAIRKDIFSKTIGFHNVGYGEDITVLSQLNGIKAKLARGAICYHFNPSSLKEVFTSARWMGRGEGFCFNLKTILTFCFPNSLRKGIAIAYRKNKPLFLIFKIVFDHAVLTGIFERKIANIHYK